MSMSEPLPYDEEQEELEGGGEHPFLIAALGNLLLMDDGVGVHVVRELQKDPPPGSLPVEVGTAVLDALHLIERSEKILAIDAVQAGKPPGTVYGFDVSKAGQDQRHVSLHELSLTGVLRLVPEHLRPREIMILGVEPERIDYGLELSPSVEAAVPKVVEFAREIIARWNAERQA